MDSRFKELTKRLVAPGKPYLSASEFHELHDYIMKSQKKKKRKPKANNLLRIVIEYETKKSMDVGRQTNFLELKEIKKKTQGYINKHPDIYCRCCPGGNGAYNSAFSDGRFS